MDAFVCSAAFGDLRGFENRVQAVAKRDGKRPKGDHQRALAAQWGAAGASRFSRSAPLEETPLYARPVARARRSSEAVEIPNSGRLELVDGKPEVTHAEFTDGTILHLQSDGSPELLHNGEKPPSLRPVLAPDDLDKGNLKSAARKRVLKTHTVTLAATSVPATGVPLPPGDPDRSAGVSDRSVDRMWAPGRPIRVSFPPNTEDTVANHVLNVAREWTKTSNTALVHAGDHYGRPNGYPSAEIRIAFDFKRRASLVGRSGAHLSLFRPTMMLWEIDTLDPASDEFRHVVLHEFGHALGLIHAHQSPAAGIRWRPDKILEYAIREGWGWDEADVARNVTTPAPEDEVMWGRYDKRSVMHYKIPSSWVESQESFGYNTRLSLADRDFIRAMYPFPDDPCQIIDIALGSTIAGQLERRTSQIYRTSTKRSGQTGFVVSLGSSARAVVDLVGADGQQLASIIAPDESRVEWNASAGDTLYLWVTRIGSSGSTRYEVEAFG